MTKSVEHFDTIRKAARLLRIRYVLGGVGVALLATIMFIGLRTRQKPAAPAAAPTFAQRDAQTELPSSPPAPRQDDLATLRQYREELDRLPTKTNADDLTLAARQARQTGDLWYANRLLHAALQQYPQHRPARLLWANTLYTQTQFAAARRLYLQLYHEDPKDAEAYIGMADVALAENRRTEALNWMSRALRESEQSPANLLRLAQKYMDWSQLSEAEAVAVRVRQIAPDNVDGRLLQASLLLQRGQVEPSRQILEPLLRQEPENAKAYRVLAAVLRHPGPYHDPQRICELFARAIELDPRDADTLRLGGDYYRQERLYRLSMQAYMRLLTLDPANLEARYGIALDYAGLGMTEPAATQLAFHKRLRERELKLQALHEQVNTKPLLLEPHLRLARFLASGGSYANAVMEYQIAIGLRPADQSLRQELADLYQRLGWGAPGVPTY
jgi:tetratricopeptide (TPR) repeat protein